MEWLLSDPSPPLPTTTGIPALSGGTLTSPLFTVPEEPPEVVDTWSKTVSTAMWRQNERPMEPSGQGTSSAAYLVDAQRRYVWQKGDAEASVCVCVCACVCRWGGRGCASYPAGRTVATASTATNDHSKDGAGSLRSANSPLVRQSGGQPDA